VCIGGGTSIEAVRSVRIGARSRLGIFSKVLDNDYHTVGGSRWERPISIPVIIGEDVQIGPHAILLPGAHLEQGSTVCARAVVRRRVPAGAIVVGNPAMVQVAK
jgi:acetyltransferase-like isoleucine patch superfamily enzyme